MTFRQLRRRYLPSWLRFLFAVRWQWQHMRVCRQYKRKHPCKHQCTMAAYCYPLYSVLLTVLKIVWLACINIGRYDIKAKSNLACVKSGITRLGDWRRDIRRCGLIVMSPSTNLPRCVIPFWTHAYDFSQHIYRHFSPITNCRLFFYNGTIFEKTLNN